MYSDRKSSKNKKMGVVKMRIKDFLEKHGAQETKKAIAGRILAAGMGKIEMTLEELDMYIEAFNAIQE